MKGERFVMFGHSHVLGDLVEIIDAAAGTLTKIVVNVAESPIKGRPTLRQRLDRLQDRRLNANRVNKFQDVLIQPLSDFQPRRDEKYVIGFTGFKMSGLTRHLTEKFDLQFTPLIHPDAVVSSGVRMPSGAILQAGVVIASDVRLEDHIFLNKGVNIGCNAVISRFASLGPGAVVGRDTYIGKGASLCIGSVVPDRLKVGDYAKVAAGACVVTDVPFNSLVAGTPAVVKKHNLYDEIKRK